jgi:hypothetical protein
MSVIGARGFESLLSGIFEASQRFTPPRIECLGFDEDLSLEAIRIIARIRHKL